MANLKILIHADYKETSSCQRDFFISYAFLCQGFNQQGFAKKCLIL